MSEIIVIVTGANKGIGFAIAKDLSAYKNLIVYATARNVRKGTEAVKKLGGNVKFHQLDIIDICSVESLKDYIKNKHGGFDILINNAAIMFRKDSVVPLAVQTTETLKVNFFSLLTVCDILFPLIRNGGRVINISSSAGHLSNIASIELRKELSRTDLKVEELLKYAQNYINAVKNDDGVVLKAWGNSAYVVSKAAVCALTFIHQRILEHRGIAVNCVHPGHVATDMTKFKGAMSPEEGAKAAIYLALEAPDDVKGVFMWHDLTIVPWDGPHPTTYLRGK